MKLPALKQYAVPNIEMISPMSHVQEAAGITSALQVVGETTMKIDEVKEKYRMNEAKMESDDNLHELEMRDAQWRTDHADIIDYNVADLPASIQSQYAGQDTVAAYKVRAELYKTYMDEQKQQLIGNVRSSNLVRDMWDSATKQYIDGKYHELALGSLGEQVKYSRATTKQRIEEATLAQNWTSVEYNINNFHGTETEKDALRLEAEQNKEISEYSRIKGSGNIPAMTGILEQMRDNLVAMGDPDTESTSNLGPKKLSTEIASMQSAINVETTRQDSGNKAYNKQVKEEVKGLTKVLEDGLITNIPTHVIDGMIAKGEVAAPLETIKLQLAVGEAEFKADLFMLPEVQRTAVLGAVRQQIEDLPAGESSSSKGLYLAQRYKRLVETNERVTNEINNDPLGYGLKSGLVKMEDISQMDVDNIAQSIKGRIDAEALVDQTWKQSKGYMFGPEPGNMSKAIRNKSLDEQAELITQVATLPEEVQRKFYNQLKNTGLSDSFSVAGLIAAKRGDHVIAYKILDGEKIQKDPRGRIPKEATTQVDQMVSDELRGTHIGDKMTELANTNAIINVYVSDMARAGKDLAKIDKNILINAVQQVEGNRISFGNSVFQAPTPDMSSSDFARWFNALSPQAVPFTSNYKNREDLYSALATGQVDLIATGEDNGTFFMRDNVSLETLTYPGTRAASIFVYNAEATTKTDVQMEKDLQQRQMGIYRGDQGEPFVPLAERFVETIRTWNEYDRPKR